MLRMPIRPDRTTFNCRAVVVALALLALAVAGCDNSKDSGQAFDDIGPGTLIGEAQSFAWSSDGERLYFTTDAPVEQDDTRYRIYEVPIGGSPRLLYEGRSQTYSGAECASVRHMEEVDGDLYFDTDFNIDRGTFGNIYRLSLNGDEEPFLVVEGAALPTGNPVTPSFDVSADGRRIAHFTQTEEAVWATARSLGTGETITSVGGAMSRFDARLRVFLSDDGERLLHNADFGLSTRPEDSYSVHDLSTGSARPVRLGLSDDSEGQPRINDYTFYTDGGDFVAVYATGVFTDPYPLVTQRVPDGTPQVVASVAESVDGLRDTFRFPDASGSHFAFWREEATLNPRTRALHVIDLEDGTERRAAGPIPTSRTPCTASFRIAPRGSHIAYLGVESEGADLALFTAEMRP